MNALTHIFYMGKQISHKYPTLSHMRIPHRVHAVVDDTRIEGQTENNQVCKHSFQIKPNLVTPTLCSVFAKHIHVWCVHVFLIHVQLVIESLQTLHEGGGNDFNKENKSHTYILHFNLLECNNDLLSIILIRQMLSVISKNGCMCIWLPLLYGKIQSGVICFAALGYKI